MPQARTAIERFTFGSSYLWDGVSLIIIAMGMFAVPDILGGTGDILIGNLIKDQFLGTRDWPFGSALSIMLTLAVLSVAGLATWFARSATGQRAA